MAIRHQLLKNTPPQSLKLSVTRLTRTKEEEVKKLEVAICDLKNQGCCNCPWCDFGTRIDNPAGMREDLKSQMAKSKPPLGAEEISQRIHIIRGHRVMLDADLAELYGVLTKAINQAVKRNAERSPDDFMFQLTWKETESLRSQIVTLKKTGRGKHPKYLPFAFTEQGVAMLSGVLNSPRAVQVNIAIMRAFVLLRRILLSHEDLARKVDALERKYDAQFRVVFDAIRALMEPPKAPGRRIGF